MRILSFISLAAFHIFVPVSIAQTPTNAGTSAVESNTTPLVLLKSVPPVYPVNAPNGHHIVTVHLRVDINGNPSHVRAVHGEGLGFDESAVEAVHQYKYRPATKDGKPIPAELDIEVVFDRP